MKRVLTAAIMLAAALAVIPVAPARADTRLRFEDPKGDALDTRASMDLVAASVEIKTMQLKGTAEASDVLLVTWELAAPPEPTLAGYEFEGEIPGCGSFGAGFRPGSAMGIAYQTALGIDEGTSQMSVGCGSPDEGLGTTTFVPIDVKVEGMKIIMSTSFDGMPKEFRAARQIKSLRAYSHVSEPVTGIMGNGNMGIGPHDEAVTNKVWTF